MFSCMSLLMGHFLYIHSPGTPASSTNKTDRHYIPEILLKVALNTITLALTHNPYILIIVI